MRGARRQKWRSALNDAERFRLRFGPYEKASEKFIIEFRYVSGDASLRRQEHESGLVNFFIGKSSNRLCRIELDVKQLGANRVGLAILPTLEGVVDEAIDKLATAKVPRAGNYSLAKEAISQRREELFADLVAK